MSSYVLPYCYPDPSHIWRQRSCPQVSYHFHYPPTSQSSHMNTDSPQTQQCLQRVSISLPWTHFPHWRPPTDSLRFNPRVTSTVKLPAFPRQTLGLLQISFYIVCFIELYIRDVYNSVSPNKLQVPLRQGLCFTSSVSLVPIRVSGTLNIPMLN